MKQKIYIAGLATLIIVILGSIFKMNHLHGANIMLIAGMLMLIFLFLPLALINNYKAEGNRQNLLLYLVTWLTCLVVFGSMLFKIQHWPYAGVLLMIALPFPYVVFLPVFLTVTGRNKNFNIYNTVFVLFLLSGISVFSVLLSLNVAKERIDDSLNLARNYNRMEMTLDGIRSPSDQGAVAGKIDDLLAVVDEYQSRIFASAAISENDWNSDPWSFPRLEAKDIGSGALVTGGKDRSPDLSLQHGLQSLISMLESAPGYEDLAGPAQVIFEYADLPGSTDEWTKQMFFSNTRAWSLIYLDGLETNLKLLKRNIE